MKVFRPAILHAGKLEARAHSSADAGEHSLVLSMLQHLFAPVWNTQQAPTTYGLHDASGNSLGCVHGQPSMSDSISTGHLLTLQSAAAQSQQAIRIDSCRNEPSQCALSNTSCFVHKSMFCQGIVLLSCQIECSSAAQHPIKHSTDSRTNGSPEGSPHLSCIW